MARKLLSVWADMNYRGKLTLLFVALALAPLSVLGVLSYNRASYTVQEKVYQTMLESLSQITFSINYFMADIEQLSMYIYSNEEIQQALSAETSDRTIAGRYAVERRISALLESFVGLKQRDIEIYILGDNGERFFTGDVLPQQYGNYDPDWGLFRKARLADGNAVWDTHYTMKKMYDFGAAVASGRLLKNIATDESIGYLVIDVMESALVDKYAKAHLAKNGQIYLLDRFGNVISSLPKHQIGTKLQEDFLPKVLDGTKGYFQTGAGKDRNVVIYVTSEVTGFKLISVLPVREVVKESQGIRELTVFVMIAGAIAAIAMAYWAAGTITDPLRKLRALMKLAEKGDLSVSFTPKHRDEVGQLGQSFNRMLEEIRALIRENYEKLLQLREAELKTVQAQLNPHFLYNTLDSIHWMARIRQADEISQTVLSLGELLRYSISKGGQVVTVREDMKRIRHYLAIQQTRFRDKITVDLAVDEAAESLFTLKLLLQPIVENAIVHGLEPKDGAGTLRISVGLRANHIRFAVQDDGVGFAPDEPASSNESSGYEPASRAGTGIGIDNVRRRLELQFGARASLTIESAVGAGTTVILEIPQIRNASEADHV